MDRYGWNTRTDRQIVNRRAGGRRRYKAERRRLAEARRNTIDRWLAEHPWALLSRGLPAAFAPIFGVHPSTISRDLQFLRGGRTYDLWCGDRFAMSVTRAYPGGPVLSVEDADGKEIRGRARRTIIRSLPRYFGQKPCRGP